MDSSVFLPSGKRWWALSLCDPFSRSLNSGTIGTLPMVVISDAAERSRDGLFEDDKDGDESPNEVDVLGVALKLSLLNLFSRLLGLNS